MAQFYRDIVTGLARRIRLVVTDVDGTIVSSGDCLSSAVLSAIRRFEEDGIMVGLASGRTLPRLEALTRDLRTSGPVIAENGGVAQLKANGELVNLGYSREPAMKAFEKLRRLFPQAIQEREDNRYRLVDVSIRAIGVGAEELRGHLDNTQILDSGYMLHLLQEGVSKGRTLMRLLPEIGDGNLSPEEVLVFGDSPTDLSLFQLFPHSVLILNPGIPVEQIRALQMVAGYVSELTSGEGFAEVACHILTSRRI